MRHLTPASRSDPYADLAHSTEQTAAGIGLGASEADVVPAYGVPDQRNPWFDGFELVYPQLGMVFGFDEQQKRLVSLGIFLGTYMQCP